MTKEQKKAVTYARIQQAADYARSVAKRDGAGSHNAIINAGHVLSLIANYRREFK
ncbi:MAG: hypothetical protein KGI70_03305 [Patescibacteria group bacterium]|nr:hypothetical protein [Patescibacteria group bacterium]